MVPTSAEVRIDYTAFFDNITWEQACACGQRSAYDYPPNMDVAELESWAMDLVCKECQILLDVWQAVRSLLHDAIEQGTISLDNANLEYPRRDGDLFFFEAGIEAVTFELTRAHVPPSMTAKEICEHVKKDFDMGLDSTDRISLAREDFTFSPKRVLHLRDGIVRLLEDCKPESWVCLSYCWGGQQDPLKLTCETMADLKTGMSSSSLPCLFQDAITVCAWFGAEYLWIDALCIIQDDEQDWSQQAGQMARIYAGSSFTIAAEDCANPSSSMLQPTYRRPPWNPIQNWAGCWVRIEEMHEPARSCLEYRAWALQETELAPFVLHFRSESIDWQTPTQWKTSQTLEPVDWESFGRNRFCTNRMYQGSSHAWFRLVSEYTTRFLTKQSDRLPAIAALAQSWSTEWNSFEGNSRCQTGRYLLGLWEGGLLTGLLWQRALHCRKARFARPTTESRLLRLPSWSWASVDYEIYYGCMHPPQLRQLASVKKIDVDIRDHGSIWLGIHVTISITIQARYIPVDLDRSIENFSDASGRGTLRFTFSPSVQTLAYGLDFDELLVDWDCVFDHPYFIQDYREAKSKRGTSICYLVILGYDNINVEPDPLRLRGLLLTRGPGSRGFLRIGSVRLEKFERHEPREYMAQVRTYHSSNGQHSSSEGARDHTSSRSMSLTRTGVALLRNQFIGAWLRALPLGTFQLA